MEKITTLNDKIILVTSIYMQFGISKEDRETQFFANLFCDIG